MKPLPGPATNLAEECGEDLHPVTLAAPTAADGLVTTAYLWLPGADPEVPTPIGTFLNPAVDILDMSTVVTSHEFTHHDVPGQPGWKEARPVPSNKTHRLDIRINDRIVYSQDVDEYQLEHTHDAVMLTATRNGALSKLDLPTNPLLPTGTPLTAVDAPPDSAPAPDADVDDPKASDADSAEPPVVETVHTGARDVEADEAQRKADRDARRKAAADAQAQPDGAAE